MKRLLYFISTFFATSAHPTTSTLLPLPNGTAMVYEYEDESLLSIERVEPDGTSLKVEYTAKDWWYELSYYAQALFNALKTDGNYLHSIQAEIDLAAHEILGPVTLRLMGYWHHAPCIGVYGEGEFSPNVRITFINGILNTRYDVGQTMEQISGAHGGVNVHYVFHPTRGWGNDLITSFFSKIGCMSEQARQLAEMWKDLIQEMGGIESEGIIIHYAHSIGASDSYTAMSLMTPEELKKIHVITIGAPSMIPDEGFASVTNYVSVRDGVCLLDPAGYLNGLMDPESNVSFIDTWWGWPIIEHPLDRTAYKALIHTFGEEFQKNYGGSL